MKGLVDHPWLLFAVLWLAMLAALELGCLLAKRTGIIHADDDRRDQAKGVRDSLFVLMSLLLGFTLAMALPRYDHRKELIVEEANAIGTTYLRTQVLPSAQQDDVRKLIREYVNARINFLDAGLDRARFEEAQRSAQSIQVQLWNECSKAVQADRSAATASFMQSLNETIDLDAKRLAAMENRIPNAVWIMNAEVALFTLLSVGVCMRRRFWFTALVVPLLAPLALALIADLDTSRSGWIRADQKAMYRLRDSLQSE